MSRQEAFAARRKKLLKQLGRDSAAILFSSKEYLRNGDVNYPFRQNSTFYYFTDFNEPEAVALFLPDRKEGEYVLFNRPRNPLIERWEGERVGQEAACGKYGADEAFDIGLLDEKIIELLLEKKRIFYELGQKKSWDQKITSWVSKLQTINRKYKPRPAQLCDVAEFSNEFRLIKGDYEQSCIKEATKLSALAHKKLMECCRPGMYEYELEARFNYEVRTTGCLTTAYPVIVGGGANACILHYVDNKDQLQEGDLVLIDAGGEYEYYAADITRTIPVNGKFSDHQRAVYELVLAAQLAVVEEVKPGTSWGFLQEVAIHEITKGLVQLGILKMSIQEALEKKAYQEFYMHNVGHWLGLDVHDVGAYKENKDWCCLQAGMVLTVEPGLYLSASEKLDPKWHNIGVRIEDDLLVTKNGCEILTENAPKTVAAIEQQMEVNHKK